MLLGRKCDTPLERKSAKIKCEGKRIVSRSSYDGSRMSKVREKLKVNTLTYCEGDEEEQGINVYV